MVIECGLVMGAKSSARAYHMACDRGSGKMSILEELEEIAEVMKMYKDEWDRIHKNLRGAVG